MDKDTQKMIMQLLFGLGAVDAYEEDNPYKTLEEFSNQAEEILDALHNLKDKGNSFV